MKREGLLFRAPREATEAPRGLVTVPEPNRRFATDLTLVWTRREGWVAVAPTIDCGCRSVLGLVVARSQEALASVDQALEAAFGAPSQVPTGVELRTAHGRSTRAGTAARCWGAGASSRPSRRWGGRRGTRWWSGCTARSRRR